MIRACIFDLDGTIINTMESLKHAVNESLRELGFPGTDQEHVRQFIGHGGRNLIKAAISLYIHPDEEAVDKAYATYKRIFAECCTYGNEPYEGVPEALNEFRKRGIRLAVISNKSQQGVEACIHKVYGDEMFDIICGERPGVPLKPDPAGIIKLTEELGVKPEECLYIGDGETDMQGGRAAGCITVGVTWGFRPREVLEKFSPDYMIDSMEDLITITPYVYVLNGHNMADRDAFYDEIEKCMTDSTDFRMGHNLDALADVLSGGFGRHSFGDHFCILWTGFRKSRETLGTEFVMKAIQVMVDNNGEYDCILKISE